MLKKVSLILCLLFSPVALAWTPNGEISKIVRLVQWHNNDDVVVKLESGAFCYIPANEPTLINFALALYMNQKEAMWHCHDDLVYKGGMWSHKVHRIYTQ